MSLHTLPPELLLQIANLLFWAKDLNSLTRCCRSFHGILNKRLFCDWMTPVVAASWAVRNNSVPPLQGLKRVGVALNTCMADHLGAGVKSCDILHDAARFGHLDLINFVLDTRDIGIDSHGGRGCTPLYSATESGRTESVRLLLDRGADPSALSMPDGSSDVSYPLDTAMRNGHDDIGKMLINAGADVARGETIIFAAIRGSLEMVTLLLEAGADLYAVCDSGQSVLHSAIFAGGEPLLIEMLLGRGLLARDREAGLTHRGEDPINTYLDTAVQNGWYNVAKMLLDEGADANFRCMVDGVMVEEIPPLLIGAISDEHYDIAELLIQRGADVDARNSRGFSALHLTSREEHLSLAKALLAAGADVSASDENGIQPLSCAECPAITKLLVAKGANCDHSDNTSDTPLMTAIENRRLDVVTALLEAGADTSCPDETGSLLHMACDVASHRIVELLLDYGLDASTTGSLDHSALYGAAGYGFSSIVKLLLKRGVDADSWARDGWTPLMNAACASHLHIMEILIRHGAKIEAKNSHYETVLLTAVEARQAPAVEYLIANGANIHAKTAEGASALILTASSALNNKELADVLLRDGRIDINLRDMYGRTALFYAAMRGQDTILESLLAHSPSADVSLKDHWGTTALSMAVRNGHVRVVEMLLAAHDKSQPILAMKDEHGRSILDWARRTSNGEIWRMLAATPEGATVDIVEDAEAMMRFDDSRCYCDVCARYWVCKDDGLYLACSKCAAGETPNFCICRFCAQDGVRCVNGHKSWEARECGCTEKDEDTGDEGDDDGGNEDEEGNEHGDGGEHHNHYDNQVNNEDDSNEDGDEDGHEDEDEDEDMDDSERESNDILDEELYLEDLYACN
ncbi:hypothetical protein PWT90_09249 [Aphanocladium album]|nr:hypothetical protein PWT90_09249 [Aphanocladium album]